eukprot:CAMPEP_0172887250 /NCGR_PEP_ID=MMETSP1075-20121228/133476_1 /TAXON_ID=2916 /ORGANISM="Ceratium fusus, Strain PA161109" /LENGTH=36 /DNA_ID= /DNA_START= /DNA_END= /DNA_ORIENTATION=
MAAGIPWHQLVAAGSSPTTAAKQHQWLVVVCDDAFG